ncbi:MAG: hypothetical protein JW836_00665 [Deltaproteobacteria bacterium]|nr:hypothetical protein [Deltaproteobacteria bacterium]
MSTKKVILYFFVPFQPANRETRALARQGLTGSKLRGQRGCRELSKPLSGKAIPLHPVMRNLNTAIILRLTDRKQDAIAFSRGGERSGLREIVFEANAGGRVKMDDTPHVTFVCVRNRVRSTFAKFYLEDLFKKRGEKVRVSSAGFVPHVLKDQLAGAKIPFPDPLFNTSMSSLTREFLLEKGIRVPEGWRSKELSCDMVDQADLVITALGAQKDELCVLYKKACGKIASIRELSEKKGYLFSEDFAALPLDRKYWYHAEEDLKYVSIVLREWEQSLISAVPNIIRRLGMSKKI